MGRTVAKTVRKANILLQREHSCIKHVSMGTLTNGMVVIENMIGCRIKNAGRHTSIVSATHPVYIYETT